MSPPSGRTAADRAKDRRPIRTELGSYRHLAQSVWLDCLRRSLFTSGGFRRLIEENARRGATSNPSIFEKAIAASTDYLDALQEIERRRDIEPMALCEALAIRDITTPPTFCIRSTRPPNRPDPSTTSVLYGDTDGAEFRRRSGFMRRRLTLRRTACSVARSARSMTTCGEASRRSTTTLGSPLRTTFTLHT